ncbi:MAG: TrkH family potassium uptake protein [Candidatus Cloacimonadaceae bacterium]|nr:TrkH family potassium uptake protein [Candidatus Cloacimonadaceae bacterium]MDP3114276.1 TrkH family potassium uptake protein [Candidatus Cloacimonadaceae bacterium]
MKELYRKALKHIEFIAYLLAIWSFFVLFLEPIISFYMNYRRVEVYTALANIVLLLLTILNRALQKATKDQRKIIFFDLIMLLMGSLLMIYQAKFVIFFLLIRQTYFILQYIIFRAFEGKLYKVLTGNPPVTLMLSFALVISIGTMLLMLPAANVHNQVTPLADALFTATSATCVTGLIVRDTGTYFTLFGQLVILLLIQIGGLGIMTVSTAFAIVLGQRITLKLESVMHKMVGGTQHLDVFSLLKNIVIVTLIIECIGAVLLYLTFSGIYPPFQAFYLSVFHSVSAFCNAGFSLFDSGLMAYTDNVNVNLSITALILLGGLGFTVLIDLHRYLFIKEKIKKLSLHTKIVLLTSGVLLAVGFISYYVAEYNGLMSGFTISRRVLSSWFQSVTTRTAGFNTIDTGGLSKASILITLVLMFIGASPGSTGGGIKTTTFAVLVLSVTSMLKGKRDLGIYNRKLPQSNYREATSLITLTVGIVFFIVFILMLVEPHGFEKLLFEAISAFGTVGLSMGITADLSVAGKILITVLMYIGRIGPLTMIYAFSIRKHYLNVNYAEEKIAIG